MGYFRLGLLGTVVYAMGGCAASQLQPGDTVQDCRECPSMVVVPSGTFAMGSPPEELDRGEDEGPVRAVTFAEPFAIGRYEVTRGEIGAFFSATGREAQSACLIWDGQQLAMVPGKDWRDPGYPQTDRHPAVCVTWFDAQAYARWLSDLTGLKYRLSGEAEWEYAARGGTTTAYAFPADEPACNYGNVSDESAKRVVTQWNNVDCDDGVGFGTAPVGSFEPNGFGLYDTIGNVWEWVADCYHPDFENAPTNGTAWGDAGDCGVALDRGGGFSNIFPGHLRAANRSRAPTPAAAVYSLGVRVVRALTREELADLQGNMKK